MSLAAFIEHESEARGVAIGEAKGVAIGEARGKARGEANAKKLIAKNMLAEGFTLEQVAKMTGLNLAEIIE